MSRTKSRYREWRGKDGRTLPSQNGTTGLVVGLQRLTRWRVDTGRHARRPCSWRVLGAAGGATAREIDKGRRRLRDER
jgi:hypothetical protein